ncbi:MAG: hypothetical protein JXK05_01960 [Campylobacterales bacterium]|nr:hypothetical protein [Campylobacterales bacterium]
MSIKSLYEISDFHKFTPIDAIDYEVLKELKEITAKNAQILNDVLEQKSPSQGECISFSYYKENDPAMSWFTVKNTYPITILLTDLTHQGTQIA